MDTGGDSAIGQTLSNGRAEPLHDPKYRTGYTDTEVKAMTDQTSKNAIWAVASESAIWMPKASVHPSGPADSANGVYVGTFRTQDDAIHLKEPADSSKPNPFVQSQSVSSQAPTSPVTPAGTQQKQS
jgi:hypothetical protein